MKSREQKPITVSEFQEYLATLYSDANKDRSFEYIYGYLNRNCSYLARAILRNKDDQNYFTKAFSWLFALATEFEIDLETAYRKKFPEKCPYCISPQCICAETSKTPPPNKAEWEIKEELISAYEGIRNSVSLRYFPIDSAVTSINKIYPGNRSIWNIYGCTFHFSRLFEELGEVHEACGAYKAKKRKIDNISEELADVFAWLLSAWGITHKDQKLSAALIQYYYNGCPVCLSNSCTCNEYQSRDQALANPEDLQKFKEILIEVSKSLPIESKELSQITNDIETIKDSSTTTEAKRVVAQGIEILNTLEKSSTTAVNITEKVKILIKNASALAGSFSWFG